MKKTYFIIFLVCIVSFSCQKNDSFTSNSSMGEIDVVARKYNLVLSPLSNNIENNLKHNFTSIEELSKYLEQQEKDTSEFTASTIVIVEKKNIKKYNLSFSNQLKTSSNKPLPIPNPGIVGYEVTGTLKGGGFPGNLNFRKIGVDFSYSGPGNGTISSFNGFTAQYVGDNSTPYSQTWSTPVITITSPTTVSILISGYYTDVLSGWGQDYYNTTQYRYVFTYNTQTQVLTSSERPVAQPSH